MSSPRHDLVRRLVQASALDAERGEIETIAEGDAWMDVDDCRQKRQIAREGPINDVYGSCCTFCVRCGSVASGTRRTFTPITPESGTARPARTTVHSRRASCHHSRARRGDVQVVEGRPAKRDEIVWQVLLWRRLQMLLVDDGLERLRREVLLVV